MTTKATKQRKPYNMKNRKNKATPEELKKLRLKWLAKNKKRFTCKLCDFGSCNQSNLRVHYKRERHIKNIKKHKEKIAKLTKQVNNIQSLISLKN